MSNFKRTLSTEFQKCVALDICVYLDIDGVLGDFDRHARENGKFSADGKVMWDALDEDWWASMPMIEGAMDFYRAVCDSAPTNFLTAGILSSASHGGKARWIEDHFGKFKLNELIICPSAQKRRLAGPHSILIDDRQKNVDEWRKAGGVAILFEGNFEDTLQELKQAIEIMFSAPPKPLQTPELVDLSPLIPR